jgi:cytochrome c biogenesis protein CcmG/thiol:disulfide interchange protein DsbE
MRKTFCLFLVVATVLVMARAPRVLASLALGQPAPALVIRELDGNTFDLAAQRGKVIIVNFWATWCPPCRHEMPALDAFYRKYHAQGLEMIGLSADRPHDRSEVTKVMQAFSYPAAMLDDATTDEFPDPGALPVTYVIDQTGTIRAKLAPNETPLTEESLSQLVLPIMAGRSAAHAEAQTR